jgi:hypothetical protein
MTSRKVDPVMEGVIKRHKELVETLALSSVAIVNEHDARFRIEVIGLKDGEWRVGAYFVERLGFAMGGDLLHDTNCRLDKVIKQEEKWDEVLYCRVLDLELDVEPDEPYIEISRAMTAEFNEMYDNQSTADYMQHKQKIEAWAAYARKSAADCLLAIAYARPITSVGRVATLAVLDNAVEFGQLTRIERDTVLALIEKQMGDERGG